MMPDTEAGFFHVGKTVSCAALFLLLAACPKPAVAQATSASDADTMNMAHMNGAGGATMQGALWAPMP